MASWLFENGGLVPASPEIGNRLLEDMGGEQAGLESGFNTIGYNVWDQESWFQIFERQGLEAAGFGDFRYVVYLLQDFRDADYEEVFITDFPNFMAFLAYIKPYNDYCYRIMERAERGAL